MPPTSQVLAGRHVRIRPPKGERIPQRRDIQGLRTVAVGLVIVYHIWPSVLPGGFVGVDVFFVISGFLIVGSLVREITKKGTLDLLSFYERRIWRLLPAATLVLISTVLATVVLLPQSRWQSISMDVIMSGLQIQNWNQAFSANSYAEATALVSPVQHYWSLAVEEQFYILIPLLLLGGVALARKARLNATTVSVWVVAWATAASFGHSVLFSSSHHEIAYFATTTRIWELGVGGLAALLLQTRGWQSGRFSILGGWLGLLGIAGSALSFSTSLNFPGYAALLPVVATLLILASGSRTCDAPEAFSVTSLLSLRPITFVGDISYSLYLWHWPVVVFYVFYLGREPGIVHGTVIAGLSVALAVPSYYLVEQRFRHGYKHLPAGLARVKTTSRVPVGSFLAALGVVIATSGSALAPWGIVEAKSQELQNLLNTREYPGAMAFDPGRPAPVPAGLPIQPDPSVALKDVPMTSAGQCGVYDPAGMGVDQCVYGAEDPAKSMVVVGDSHAAQFVDPLVFAGAPAGWEVRAMVRNGCPFASAPAADATTVYHNCSNQNQLSLQRILDLRPDLVVVAGMAPEGYEDALGWHWDTPESLVNGYVGLLGPLRAAGLRVAVVLDNPYPRFSAPDCVQRKGADSAQCQVTRPPGDTGADPLRRAADQVEGVEVLDLSEYVCRGTTCPAVIGNVLVYRDNHLTNTFAKSLAPVLARRLGL